MNANLTPSERKNETHQKNSREVKINEWPFSLFTKPKNTNYQIDATFAKKNTTKYTVDAVFA